MVGGERSWEGCGGGGWAGVVVIRGEDGGLGSEPDASGGDGCVFSAAGVGGSSWIRGEGEGGLVGGELVVVEGGEIRGLRVDNGGGEGGVTGGEEGPDTQGNQHAVLFHLCTKEQAASAYVQCSSPEKNEEERKSIHGKNYPQICEGSK